MHTLVYNGSDSRIFLSPYVSLVESLVRKQKGCKMKKNGYAGNLRGSHAEAWCWKVAETAYMEKAKNSGMPPWAAISQKNKDKWYRFAFWIMRALDILE